MFCVRFVTGMLKKRSLARYFKDNSALNSSNIKDPGCSDDIPKGYKL
jgi:hypothetical protein